jgi:hypothetical protein
MMHVTHAFFLSGAFSLTAAYLICPVLAIVLLPPQAATSAFGRTTLVQQAQNPKSSIAVCRGFWFVHTRAQRRTRWSPCCTVAAAEAPALPSISVLVPNHV